MDVPFLFTSIVWGDNYVDRFIRYMLPSVAAPGNLGAFAGGNHRYLVFTRLRDFPKITSSPAWQKISTYVSCELREIALSDVTLGERMPFWDAWTVVNKNFRRAIAEAAPVNAAIGMLIPDVLWADGSLSYFQKLINSGKKVIFVSGCHTQPDTIMPALQERYLNEAEGVLQISCRDLVRLSIEHFHEYSRRHYWADPHYHTTNCGNLYWDIPGEGFVGRNFAASPEFFRCDSSFFDWPEVCGYEFVDYVAERIPNPEDHYYVEDTDEAVSLGLETQSPGDRDWKYPPEDYFFPANIIRAATWVSRATSPLQQEIARRRIRWHYADRTAAWDHIERESDEVLESVLQCAALYKAHPRIYQDAVAMTELQKSLRTRICETERSAAASLDASIGELDEILNQLSTLDGAQSLYEQVRALRSRLQIETAQRHAVGDDLAGCRALLSDLISKNSEIAAIGARAAFDALINFRREREALTLGAELLNSLQQLAPTMSNEASDAVRHIEVAVRQDAIREFVRKRNFSACIPAMRELSRIDPNSSALFVHEMVQHLESNNEHETAMSILSDYLRYLDDACPALGPEAISAVVRLYFAKAERGIIYPSHDGNRASATAELITCLRLSIPITLQLVIESVVRQVNSGAIPFAITLGTLACESAKDLIGTLEVNQLQEARGPYLTLLGILARLFAATGDVNACQSYLREALTLDINQAAPLVPDVLRMLSQIGRSDDAMRIGQACADLLSRPQA